MNIYKIKVTEEITYTRELNMLVEGEDEITAVKNAYNRDGIYAIEKSEWIVDENSRTDRTIDEKDVRKIREIICE